MDSYRHKDIIDSQSHKPSLQDINSYEYDWIAHMMRIVSLLKIPLEPHSSSDSYPMYSSPASGLDRGSGGVDYCRRIDGRWWRWTSNQIKQSLWWIVIDYNYDRLYIYIEIIPQRLLPMIDCDRYNWLWLFMWCKSNLFQLLSGNQTK